MKKYISRHASNRMQQRTNFSANQKNHNINRAWQYGRKIDNYTDPFYSFLLTKQQEGNRTVVKIYEDNIYVFENKRQRLITVYPVPEEYVPTKQFLGKQKGDYVIRVGDDILPMFFTSLQAAHNYIRNNLELCDNEDIEVIAI